MRKGQIGNITCERGGFLRLKETSAPKIGRELRFELGERAIEFRPICGEARFNPIAQGGLDGSPFVALELIRKTWAVGFSDGAGSSQLSGFGCQSFQVRRLRKQYARGK